MKSLRSAPFLPVACLEHRRIFSCCDTLIGFGRRRRDRLCGRRARSLRLDVGVGRYVVGLRHTCADTEQRDQQHCIEFVHDRLLRLGWDVWGPAYAGDHIELTQATTRRTSDAWTMRTNDAAQPAPASNDQGGVEKTRRRPDCSGAALSVRPGGQEVTRPDCETLSVAFMHSLCALARSSLFMPVVFLLHIAILLSGFSLRQASPSGNCSHSPGAPCFRVFSRWPAPGRSSSCSVANSSSAGALSSAA